MFCKKFATRVRFQAVINRLPHVKAMREKLAFYDANLMVPPGHFYSPLVNVSEILEAEENIFRKHRAPEGIELNEEAQWQLMSSFAEYYKKLPFTESPVNRNRYYYNNSYFSYADAVFLFCMMLHHRPKRIIEVGSGFTSALMLDVNETFFDNVIDLTCIEPFPDMLQKLTRPTDRFTILQTPVQKVDLRLFNALQPGDFLFIDSTHVVKTGSDVLFEMFNILPLLVPGVIVHFHDIFYPFEYPRDWVVDLKRNWNEIYLLRAYLMYNQTFSILAFNTFLETTNPKWFEEHMPLCLKNTGGSCWLKKIV